MIDRAREMVVSAQLFWRVALLGVVFAADLVVFIGLCREELRGWRTRRPSRGSKPVGKGVPALSPSVR
jgi:hypothetical protein